MTKPSLGAVGRLLRLWGLVLAGNMVGVALFTWGIVGLDITDIDTQAAMLRMGSNLLGLSARRVFARGIVAGWLIAIPVWRMPSAEHSKVVLIAVIAVIAGMIGFAELTHIVAGSGGAPPGVQPRASLGDVAARFMLPALEGNVVGGSLVFALIRHA